MYQGIGSKSFLVHRFSGGQGKKRLQPSQNAHLVKRILNISRSQKPVLSVLSRSLKFDTAKSVPFEKCCRWRIQKMSVACAYMNDEPLGNEEETKMFNLRRKKSDGTSLHQITYKTHVVTLAVLENWISVPTRRSQPGFHISNLRNRTKHTLPFRIQVRTS